MALLVQDDIFKCEKCMYPEFTVKDIESFTVAINKDESTSLLSNTKRQVLVCNNCGNQYEINEKLKLERA